MVILWNAEKMKHNEKIKTKILEAGIKVWHDNPMSVTARFVAKTISMDHATILYHFGKQGIRNAIAEYAVKIGDSKIIVQLIASCHPTVSNLPKSAKNRHMKKMCEDVR